MGPRLGQLDLSMFLGMGFKMEESVWDVSEDRRSDTSHGKALLVNEIYLCSHLGIVSSGINPIQRKEKQRLSKRNPHNKDLAIGLSFASDSKTFCYFNQ